MAYGYPAEADVEPTEAFAARMGPLFEGASAFLARLAEARPFGSWRGLFDRARTIAHGMPEPDQLELVDAHPRLGAPAATVSALSFREQGYDAEEAANLASEAVRERDAVAAELDRFNRAYEAHFGFRYCVFVAGRSRSELLPGMGAALAGDRAEELGRAIDAVIDIAIDRQRTLAAAPAESPHG